MSWETFALPDVFCLQLPEASPSSPTGRNYRSCRAHVLPNLAQIVYFSSVGITPLQSISTSHVWPTSMVPLPDLLPSLHVLEDEGGHRWHCLRSLSREELWKQKAPALHSSQTGQKINKCKTSKISKSTQNYPYVLNSHKTVELS